MTASELLDLADEMAAAAPADPVAWLRERAAKERRALRLKDDQWKNDPKYGGRVGKPRGFYLCTVEACSWGLNSYFDRHAKELSLQCFNGWCDDAEQLIREAEAAGFEVRR